MVCDTGPQTEIYETFLKDMVTKDANYSLFNSLYVNLTVGDIIFHLSPVSRQKGHFKFSIGNIQKGISVDSSVKYNNLVEIIALGCQQHP